MSTSRVLQWGCICLLFAGIGAGRPNVAAQDAKPDAEQEMKELRAANAGLQAQNAVLAKRNTQLESQIKQLQVQLSALRMLTPPTTPSPQRIPDDWKRGEFNGMPVYIIPLDTGGSPITRPAHR